MKIKNIIRIILISLFIIIIHNSIFAFNVGELTGTAITDANTTKVGNSIITAITTIGSVISVVILIIIGIKYMIGSVEEKATYKNTLAPYFFGAICVFAASTIAGIIYNVAINI
mgnify:CR=1 FL=1